MQLYLLIMSHDVLVQNPISAHYAPTGHGLRSQLTAMSISVADHLTAEVLALQCDEGNG